MEQTIKCPECLAPLKRVEFLSDHLASHPEMGEDLPETPTDFGHRLLRARSIIEKQTYNPGGAMTKQKCPYCPKKYLRGGKLYLNHIEECPEKPGGRTPSVPTDVTSPAVPHNLSSNNNPIDQIADRLDDDATILRKKAESLIAAADELAIAARKLRNPE